MADRCASLALRESFSLEDEVDFVLATFERALGLASRLPPLAPDAPPETVTRDRELTAELETHTAAFRASLLELEPAVEALRAAALAAYGAVRTAQELRKPPVTEEPSELLPFDEEDLFLAGIR